MEGIIVETAIFFPKVLREHFAKVFISLVGLLIMRILVSVHMLS